MDETIQATLRDLVTKACDEAAAQQQHGAARGPVSTQSRDLTRRYLGCLEEEVSRMHRWHIPSTHVVSMSFRWDLRLDVEESHS